MEQEKELARKIIERFRARPEWIPNHSLMDFWEIQIGYYDTKPKDEYFTLKYDNIEFCNHKVGYNIDYGKGKEQSTFSLLAWLNQLDEITKPKPKKVVIDGVEYQAVI